MLEQALIDHCAPTLARLKIASLFALPGADEACLARQLADLNAQLGPKGLRLTPLGRQGGRTLLYLYRPDELAQALGGADVRAFLAQRGYADLTPDGALARLRAHLQAQGDFPHEIGVFLGYPLTDVIAFIRNGGRNCLCCGCWKVYSNECAARRRFDEYRRCKRLYARKFREGCPLSRLAVASRPTPA